MDRWSSLPIQDRAELINTYVRNGVTSLNDMRSHYNSFADGGGLLSGLLDRIRGNKTEDTNNNANKLIPSRQLFGLRKPKDPHPRVRPNDIESTRALSEKIEDDIHARQLSRNTTSEDWFIPYIDDKTIKVPGVGRVSSNMLDSLAVNASRAGIPLSHALGLSSVETKFGAIPNFSMASQSKSDIFTPEEKQNLEQASMNASYARNFGGIYPQFLINDHDWDGRGWEQSPKYEKILGDIESPLQHGFTLFKLGLYNTGDKNHTSKVVNEGNRLMGTPVIKEWIKSSPEAQKALKQK